MLGELPQCSGWTDVVGHPGFHEWFGGLPQVEFRIQLPAESFDVQKRFLQQYELRLHFHVELAGGMKQLDQELAKRNLVERFGEYGFADFLDDLLECAWVCLFGNPAGFQMQTRHLGIIAIEKGEEVACQIILVLPGECADDRAVDGDVRRVFRIVGVDENIAGVHVCMEKIVDENLREESLHAALGQDAHVGPTAVQLFDVTDGHTVDAFETQHVAAAEILINPRYVQ